MKKKPIGLWTRLSMDMDRGQLIVEIKNNLTKLLSNCSV